MTIIYALQLIEKKNVPNAYLVIPFLLFQSFYFTVSGSELAEPLAAAILAFGYSFYLNKKFLYFAIAGSLLPLARMEMSVLLILWVYILFISKNYRFILILFIPCLIWSQAGTLLTGQRAEQVWP